MQIKKIKIENILGISSMEFEAGKFTEITGKNGEGKTSVLEAIKSALKSGHDATLLRTGSKGGEAVIVLDDGVQITKKIGENDSATIVTDADGKRVNKPALVIKQLTDMMSVNPIDFLRSTKKERVSVLLESLPIVADSQRLEAITGLSDIPDGHALIVLESIYKSIYDNRTGLNRAIKEKRATINQLSETLPDQIEGDTDQSDLLIQLKQHDDERDNRLNEIETKLEGYRIDHELKLEELMKKINTEKQSFASILEKSNIAKNNARQKHAENTTAIRENIAAIQEQQKQAAKHESTRQTIVMMSEQAADMQNDADAMSSALTNLETYKSELLGSLPITGLTVIDGEIYRNGVQFDRLNTAQQVEISIEIAKLRAGHLPVCCADGLELLDSERFEEFKKQSIESGLQLFVTRVTDDALEIKTN